MDFPYGYCGMPCALCTRYRTEGASRCPGCSANGYYTDTCKAHHCCRDQGCGHCGSCPQYPCPRVSRMGEFSNLRTHRAKQRACDAVAAEGLQSWYAGYAERATLLTLALERYNDGRSKRFLCELFLRCETPALRELMRRAEPLTGLPKERARAFRLLVSELAPESEQ